MKFDIIEVFTRAWKITWKYKVLWVFGILASCGRGSSGNFNSGSGNGNNGIVDTPFTPEMMRQFESFAQSMVHWFEQNPWIIYVLIAAFLILWFIQIFITTVGQVGLIRGAYHAEMGIEKINFGELFSESLGYFWRVIGLGLLVFLPVIVVFAGLFVALIFLSETTTSSTGGEFGIILLVIGMCCCFLPFLIALGMFYTQAVRALIVENLGIIASLSRGWEVFRKNIVGLLVMGVIIFIASLIIGIIIAIPIYIAILPVMISFFKGNINSWQPFIIVGVFVLLYSPIAWFLKWSGYDIH